ncbi:MAG TPA: ribonuclease R [Candidatus Scatomonas pullistercoris]|uniref:Ribonuclease R n=1 Tax=Candidatus Scatomonas pullistercoris TaxID=2840920 RepID=A0A9D1P351_9FIRM|nr:ribonuclease R [Candidatus Scatomonas pullistercoris]
MIYDLFCTKNYVPMKAKEIAALLQIPRGKRKELQEVLDALTEEGLAVSDARGRYRKKKKEKPAERVRGIFIGNKKGFGFVEIPDSEEEDIFIPEDCTGGALHMDEVEVELSKKGGDRRREGKVVKVHSHAVAELVGTYERSNHFGFVTADNPKISVDIFIPQGQDSGAKTGQKVVVRLTSYGDGRRSPEGKVTEILGHAGDVGVDVLSVARGMNIPMEFPEKVLRQADRCPDGLIPNDFNGRLDLRSWQMVTIDGEDAKDLDDAVSVCREGEYYRLGVHIADVSNYVQGGSALDREALKRGTSVYLVDRVIPMLPERLSNGICSLNAGEDRLALSCIMKIDSQGRVADSRIAETVIRVDRRMSYTVVNRILTEQPPELMEEYRELVPMFFQMNELAGILRKNRSARGAIDFEFPESKILLDRKGHPVEIRAYEQNAATQLIEDFMLMANETVARTYCKKELPFLYRTHENPDTDRMEAVLTFIRNQGIRVEKTLEDITPGEIQKILQQIQGSPKEALISRLLLRSMKQAKYTTGCSGHFGLAAKYYCHFTSPIRRYPDLQIHRIIKDDLRGRMRQEKIAHYAGILEDVALQSSVTERRAQEAERETDKLKIAEYMAGRIGEEYEGIISGVTGWGFYVELENTVEGLVHVSSLEGDYYHFDEENYRLVGEITGREYTLGQSVRIRVKDADVETKTVDFVLAGEREDE